MHTLPDLPLRSGKAGNRGATGNRGCEPTRAERGTLGLPLVRLPFDFVNCPGPHGLVTQGRGGSVLIALDRAGAGSGRRASGSTALFFDAPSGEWNEARVLLEGESSADGCVWAFEVRAGGGAHPVALDELERFSPEAMSVDPRSGLFCLTDDDGYTCGFYRFRSRRPPRLPSSPPSMFSLEQGAVFEMLRVRRTRDGALPPVRPGDRIAAQWVPVATFAGNERWLFVNVHPSAAPFAITGTWDRVLPPRTRFHLLRDRDGQRSASLVLQPARS